MNPTHRPTDVAPGGMRGATRMHDPSEAAHDRVRRRCINLALLAVVLLNALQIRLVGVHGIEWLGVVLLVTAALPLGLAIKVFELRFKMGRDERIRVLRELPRKRKTEFVVYAVLASTAFWLNAPRASWALFGVWLNDFVTYYHDRPERMRHLYAVTKTLDELREFPAPWVWPLPALALEILRRM